MDYRNLQNCVYRNAAMGITALKQVIPNVYNSGMKKILVEQLDGYKKQTALTAAQMKSHNLMPSFPPLSSRLMLKASAAMKLRRDSSSENIAKMLIEGTNMGIIELTANVNKSGSDSPEAVKAAKEYLRREEKYINSLKPFL